MLIFCHSVVNDLLQCWQLRGRHFFLFLSGICVCFLWLYIFRQPFKPPASNFSIRSGSRRFLPIYWRRYLALSSLTCTNTDGVIGDGQDCAYQQWALRTNYLWRLFHSSNTSQPAQSNWWSIVIIVGSSHLSKTTVFGVLLIQYILISLLSECSYGVI